MQLLFKMLTDGLAAAQTMLDEEAERDIALWRSTAAEASAASEFARAVHVNPLRLAEMRIATDVVLKKTADEALSIRAGPVHTFYSRRYGSSQLSACHIDIHVEAVAADRQSAPDTVQHEDNAHG